MGLGLGLNCCCTQCTGLCDDVRNINFLCDITGFTDAPPVFDPPGLGPCSTCDAINQTYVLTYRAPYDFTPFPGCTTTDEDTSILPCFYAYGTECLSTGAGGTDSLLRQFSLSLRVYVTLGGDRRGYLQQIYYVHYQDGTFTNPERLGYSYYGKDFLIQAGSASTTCLDFTLTDTFDQVCQEVIANDPFGFDCHPGNSFSLSVVEA